MRKLMLIFLMLLLPVQWSAALAADCCLRQAEAAIQHLDSAHVHHHALHAEKPGTDSQHAKNDCKLKCVSCHAHQCSAAIFALNVAFPVLHASLDDTPYQVSITTPLTDSLFRPPLVTFI